MTGKADAVRAVSEQFKDRTNTVIEGVMAHLRDDNAKEILGPGLSPLIGRGSLKAIVTFALYADVLRMVRDVVMADGEISDEEVQESLGLLSVLAAGFAKVRKEYASFTQLSPETARQFLSQYESDAGLFGHANEATKWAGVNLCHMVQSEGKDPHPLNAFRGALVTWADALAGADEVTASEQSVLESLRRLLGVAIISAPSSLEPENSTNESQLQADYQACEDLLCSGESRGDFIKEHVDRLSVWKKSADAKDPRGQLLYGLCFFYGHGEPENESTAVEWFKRSAEQGDANAQYSLGMCYGNGWGVHRDEKTATQWYRKAAAQGYRAAVKVLTKAIAKQFAVDDSSVNLNEFTQIEDAAAEVLSTYEGALYLSELYTISDAAAESLSKHSGDLDLRSIGTLSAKAAKALAQHRGVLDLSLLENLGGVEVKLFRDLNALAPLSLFESFTPEMESLYRAAKQASQDDLANAWLYCHNPEFGRSPHEAFFDFWDTLSKCRRIPLWMMYDEEEESWKFFQGTQEEVMSRLKSICGDAGENVVGSHDEGEPAANEAECSKEGEEQVAEGSCLTREVAKRFVADPDSVELSEYTSIEDDAAEVLSLHQGELSLDSITHVSVEALTALSKHRGCVNLRGLAGISKDHASVLAGFLSGIEVPIDDCDPEVQKILLTHPSFRIHDYSELTEWLLEKLEFDEDVDSGRAWVSEEVVGVLLDVCACWQSADAANGVEMTGSDLDKILTSVKAAGTQEIHIVRLFDNDQSVFMFVGTVEDIKNRLLPIASCESKKNPVDDDDNEDDNEDEDEDEDEDDE